MKNNNQASKFVESYCYAKKTSKVAKNPAVKNIGHIKEIVKKYCYASKPLN
jgi:hypothetical protein